MRHFPSQFDCRNKTCYLELDRSAILPWEGMQTTYTHIQEKGPKIKEIELPGIVGAGSCVVERPKKKYLFKRLCHHF